MPNWLRIHGFLVARSLNGCHQFGDLWVIFALLLVPLPDPLRLSRQPRALPLMQSVTRRLSPVLPMTPYLNQLKPWVSVICTCFNQEAYVEAALQSVVDQTYPNVELLVIDNASTDGSASRIRAFVAQHPTVRFIEQSTNVGLCRAFNQGMQQTRGDFVIDLAADDVLLPDRIARQIEVFERLPEDYAVVFSNAQYINEAGTLTGYHFPVDEQGHSRRRIPTGRIFQQVLDSYFICTPTMLIRRSVLEQLGGYDESLSYEDFDFWVRSARDYRYAYVDEVLTLKRQLAGSLSMQVIWPDNQLLESTLAVCYKAFDRCQTSDEYVALANRIRRFIRKCFYAEQFDLARRFGQLLRYIVRPDPLTYGVLMMSRLHVPVNGLYRQYLRWTSPQ